MALDVYYEQMLPRLQSLYFVIKSTKNWISALLVRYGKKQFCYINFRNGYKFELNKDNWQKYILLTHLFSLLPSAKLNERTISFNYNKRTLIFDFGSYGFDTVFEVFAFDPYRDFMKTINPAGKIVVDIGAAFGDTAIYFLEKGASRTIAIEAFPGYFELAQRNIKKNGYEDRCEVVLSAVGGKNGNLVIDPHLTDMFGANMEQAKTGVSVPMITLSDLVNKYEISNGFLKLDTEGYEYDILLNTPKEVVRAFSDMLIEYHYGFERVEDYLKQCGYSVSHTGPTHVYVPNLVGENARNMYTGHVLAKRID